MRSKEKILVEALDTLLAQKAQLGVPDPPDDQKEEVEHTFQFLHEQINDLFAIKTADFVHHDGVCQAFGKIHSYKYLTDPTFHICMERELKAQGIPANERTQALDFVPKIIEEVRKDSKNWEEKDSGFHPDLEDVMRPE